MRYIYKNIINKFDPEFLSELDSACMRLHRKMDGISLKNINISEYNQRYIGEQLNDFVPVLQTYAYLVAIAINDLDQPLDKICVVDYGAGAGIISLLLKELGVGAVIYNDIYDVSCADAKILSKNLAINIDHFVIGELKHLGAFCQLNSIDPDYIISFDVIEHIYNIEEHIKDLSTVSKNGLRTIFGSGANSSNPFLRRRYIKAQRKIESQDRIESWGHKERDSLKAYLKIRKEIICAYAPQLSKEDIDKLSTKTRGLTKPDILDCVNEFIKTGKISYSSDHPTNTCDPHTGNWAEHLMNTDWLCELFQKNGFSSKVVHGYWGYSENALKAFILSLLNILIEISRTKSVVFAPYYIIVGNYGKTD